MARVGASGPGNPSLGSGCTRSLRVVVLASVEAMGTQLSGASDGLAMV